jgi:predicted MFS family arabinose efflux permease
MAVVGFGYFWGMAALNNLIQSNVDDTMRGRMVSLYVVAWGGMIPLGALWQGVMAEWIGIRGVIVLCGALTFAASLGVALLMRDERSRRAATAEGTTALSTPGAG